MTKQTKTNLINKHAALVAAPLLLSGLIASPIFAEDSLVDAAKSTLNCRTISDADERLACFDAAATKLADLLSPAKVEAIAETTPPAKPTPPKAVLPVADGSAVAPSAPTQPDTPAADDMTEQKVAAVPETPQPEPTPEQPRLSTEDGLPIWAAAPQYTREELAEEPRDTFQATIVRITRTKAGKHRFYTESGAVWEQTQKVKVNPPKSLPAVAEFRRRMTGNPMIKFPEVSNRSYRVRRTK